MEKMEFVQKWIGALRSGEYQQCTEGGFCGRDVDGNDVSYCCIGLAQKLLTGDANYYNPFDEMFPEFLKDPVFEEPARSDEIYTSGMQRTLYCHLTAMNDGIGLYYGDQRSFSQIADLLEEKVLNGGVK